MLASRPMGDGGRSIKRLDEVCTARSRGMSSANQLLLLGMIMPVAVICRWFYRGVFTTDFIVFWEAARLFLSGEWTTIYQSSTTYNFPYPPHGLLLFAPFGTGSVYIGLAAWSLFGAAFFAWTASRHVQPVLAILTPGSLMCLYYGQTGLVMGGLWLLAFRGQWLAVALLSFKPHLGLLSALTLRDKNRVLQTAAVIALLVLPFLTLWDDFFEHSIVHGGEFQLRSVWSFIGVSPGIAYGWAGWVPFAAAAALIVMRNFNVFTAATATLLISPYAFSYDMPVACLGIWLAVRRHWDELGPVDRLGLALGFLAPSLARTGIWWIPPILLWCLWVQVKLPCQFGQGVGNGAVADHS